MSESENDEDFVPDAKAEKEYESEMARQKIEEKDEKEGFGMTEEESKEAEEILKSFKLKIPFKETRKIEKKKEIKTYDFAGETIEVDESTGLENSVKVNQYQKRSHIPLRRKVSGLDLILSGKKPKMSVMKKSKMDWEAHRKKDNLEEELNNVKNSKKSIVDKNDFLLRTDHRTFELEREERLKRINNRKNN